MVPGEAVLVFSAIVPIGSPGLNPPVIAAPVAGIVALLELAIGAAIVFGLIRSRAVRSSTLAVATAVLFAAGAMEHSVVAAAVAAQSSLLPRSIAGPLGWGTAVAEVVMAALLAYYLRLYRYFGMLSGGVAPGRGRNAPAASESVDASTGLSTIDIAMESLRRALLTATHTAEPLAVLVVELDNLDELDRGGDDSVAARVRVDTGSVLRDQLKDSDFAAAFGPDDRFLVVLPGAGVEIATAVGRRIMSSIQRLLVSHLVDLPVRVCVGIATRSLDGADAPTLVESATEMAVYARRLGGGVYARSRDDHALEDALDPDGSEIAFEAMRISTQALIQSLRNHHPETAAHSKRVADLALRIADRLDYRSEDRSLLRYAALLHDIGMLGVPREILDRSSHLTAAQYEIVKRHPRLGYELLRGTPWLQSVATYVMYHHEGMGGHGYPEKLQGQEIPIASRIIGVAEAFDSMRHQQPYRKALFIKESLDRLRRGVPMQFDPDVVDALERALKNTRSLKRNLEAELDPAGV